MPDRLDHLLGHLTDRHRDDVVTAWAALEHGGAPAPEAALAALRDATLRQVLERLLAGTGRTLVRVGDRHWTSGFRDDVAARLAAEGWGVLPALDRAVLVLVLIHSVAVPRAEGRLAAGGWRSPYPTTATHLRKLSQLHGQRQLTEALARLRAAGLVRAVRGGEPADPGRGAGYLPGPGLDRLTPAARRRLHDNLILAAGPETALAAAVRMRRRRAGEGRLDGAQR